jgi:hypothetical protein
VKESKGGENLKSPTLMALDEGGEHRRQKVIGAQPFEGPIGLEERQRWLSPMSSEQRQKRRKGKMAFARPGEKR